MSPHGNPEFPASTADSGSRSLDTAEDQSADRANAAAAAYAEKQSRKQKEAAA